MATSALEAELEELKKRKREVDAALREERKSSKRSSRAAAKAAKSLPSMILELDADNMAFDVVVPPALATHKDKQTVLTLYDLSGQCADVVASWLLGQGRSKDSEQVQYDAALRQRATAGVEWLFIKSPVEALGLGSMALLTTALAWVATSWNIGCSIGLSTKTVPKEWPHNTSSFGTTQRTLSLKLFLLLRKPSW